MRKLICPKCKIPNLFLKNASNERRLIYVLADLTIVPSRENETLDGFNLDEIFCLGCSWSGSVRQLLKF
ncbi:MAG: hypothetical protein RR346_05235 [Bacteroidales bacterium]